MKNAEQVLFHSTPNTSQDFCTHSNSKCTATLCPWPVPSGTSEARVETPAGAVRATRTSSRMLKSISSAVSAHPLHKTTETCHKTCVRHAKACSSHQKKHVKYSRANLKGANFSHAQGSGVISIDSTLSSTLSRSGLSNFVATTAALGGCGNKTTDNAETEAERDKTGTETERRTVRVCVCVCFCL